MPNQDYDLSLKERLLDRSQWTKNVMPGDFISLAQKVRNEVSSDTISGKIAYIFILHQNLHEITKDLIQLSNLYVQAEIWPTVFKPAYDSGKEKMTGWYIEYYLQHCIDCRKKKEYVVKVKRLNHIRNKIGHNLVDKNDSIICASFDEFMKLYDKALNYADTCQDDLERRLEDVLSRVDFDEII